MVMPPLVIEPAELHALVAAIGSALQDVLGPGPG